MTEVSDVMSAPVLTVDLDATRRDIACFLLERGVSALPVLDARGVVIGVVSEADVGGGRAVGIVTRRDLLDAMAEALGRAHRRDGRRPRAGGR